MTHRNRYIVSALLAVVLACIVVYFYFKEKRQSMQNPDRTGQALSVTRSIPLNTATVDLYFADRENIFLIAESRSLLHDENPSSFGKRIINSLIVGPTEGLVPTIPQGTVVRALYVLDDGTAFVDLSEAVSEHHPGGIKSELLTVFSIVNSLVLNISEINSVKILVEGRETSTLAGHIDIRFPFKANMLLVR